MVEPRHVLVMSLDTANTVLKYFPSHSDVVIPGVSESDIFRGKLLNVSSYSQSLNPVRASSDIGNINFTLEDAGKTIAGMLNAQLLAQYGLRGKRLQHWVGERGQAWSSEYDLIQVMQFYKGIGWVNAGLQFSAEDIQRSELVDIFDPVKTTLTASLPLTTVTITVNSTTGLELIQHGSSYSDAPNEEVGYVKVDSEVIRWTAKTATTLTIDNETTTLNGALAANAASVVLTDGSSFRSSGSGYIDDLTAGVKYPITWTGKTSNTLTGVTGITAAITTGENVYDTNGRGVLNTRPAAHEVDTDQPADKRKKLEEYIYYELPVLKFEYAIQTGTLYGSADTIPAHHTLGISTDWIATSQFIGIGTDIWDPADDSAGKIFRFEGLKKTNAKKFIEEKLNFLIGVFNPVLNTGELGVKRMAAIMPDAAYTRIIKTGDIKTIGRIFYDFDDIHNKFKVKWNHKGVIDDYTREVLYVDNDSIATWGEYKEFEVEARGLHGSIHTDNIIGTLINVWRNRHAGPPLKMSLTLGYEFRNLKVGQVVRVEVDNITEFTDENGNYQTLAISAEVQRVSVNFISGDVTVNLFASTKKAAPIALGSGTALADSWYTSQGSDISGVGTITGATSGGGTIFTINANSSLVGSTDLNSASAISDNDVGIFYWDGDLIIDAGVTLTITENVELRVKGTFTNNGTIDGKGRGLTGGATGQAGYVGATQAGGGIFSVFAIVDNAFTVEPSNFAQPVTEGLTHQAGPFLLDPGDSGTSLNGKPGDLRGSSGGAGGDYTSYGNPPEYTATGGDGGDGGAGLLIVCRGAAGGVSSSIDLSGDDGADGQQVETSTYTYIGGYIAGSGAGGYPGALVVLLDGDTVTNTLTDYFTANLGTSNLFGVPYTNANNANAFYERSVYYRSIYEGFPAESKAISNLWIDYIPVPTSPVEDTADVAPLASAINITEYVSTQNSVNRLGLEVSVTAPSDSDYYGSRIYIKLSTDTEFSDPRDVYGNQEAVYWVHPDGLTYDFKAHSISITGEESEDYISRSFTVTNTIVVEMPVGNSLVGSGNMSGNAADETLVPNGFFDDPITGTFVLTEGAAPTTTPTIANDATEGNYLNLPENAANGYGYGSKTFRIIPGMSYRFRVRAKHDGAAGTDDGFYFRLQYKDTFVEPITSANRDGFNDFITGTGTVITDVYATYEYDYVIPAGANWANIALYNWTQSTVGFQVVFVEVIPMGLALSANDVSFNVNDDTFGNQGIQAQYNGGTPRLYVGDGVDKFIKFDGSDFEVGRDTEFLGADAFANEAIYYSGNVVDFVDAKATSGGGTVTDTNTGLKQFTVTSGGDAADSCIWRQQHFVTPTFAKNRRFRIRVFVSNSSTRVIVCSGITTNSTDTTDHFGFRFEGGNLYGTNGSGTGQTQTTLITSVTLGVWMDLLADFTAGVNVKYYHNGTLYATVTTNLPNDASNATRILYSRLNYVSGSGNFSTSDFRFVQEK